MPQVFLTASGLIVTGDVVGLNDGEQLTLHDVKVCGLPNYMSAGVPLMQRERVTLYLGQVVCRWEEND
jgi:hypothetical protein